MGRLSGTMHPPTGGRVLWENCNTTNDNWGFDSRAKRFKSGREIVHMIVKAAAGGRNLLLNVGPLPSGRIDSISTESLNETGAWLKANGESIYGTTSFRPVYYDNTFTTARGDKVYLHLLDWKPAASCDLWQLSLANARRAYFLQSGEPVKFTHSHALGLRLSIRNTSPVRHRLRGPRNARVQGVI